MEMTTNIPVDTSFLALDAEENGQEDRAVRFEVPGDKKRRRLLRVKDIVGENLTVLLTFVGVMVGLALGFGLRHLQPSSDLLMWIGMPGEIFLRSLKLVIVPLIVCSVVTVTASMESRASGQIGLVALVYIVVTNVLGCATGVICCVLLLPGDNQVAANVSASQQTAMEAQDIFADLLRNMFPDNIVEATFRKTRTAYTLIDATTNSNGTSSTTVAKALEQSRSVNLIGLVVVSALIGMAASKIKSRSEFFVSFFAGASEVVMTLTRGLFWFAPLGLACLTAVSVAKVEDISNAFARLGRFALSSAVGIVFLQLVVLPLVLFVFTRSNPFRFLLSVVRPYLVAFASTSTAVALADMLDACEEKSRVDKRVTRVVLPLAVALAKGGSAVYITSAVVFMAQTHHSLDASILALIGVLVVFGAMAIPAVPSSSVVTVVIILTSLGVPADDVALLFAMEWILDRLRTACNVICQTSCAVVTSRICRKNLKTNPLSEKVDV